MVQKHMTPLIALVSALMTVTLISCASQPPAETIQPASSRSNPAEIADIQTLNLASIGMQIEQAYYSENAQTLLDTRTLLTKVIQQDTHAGKYVYYYLGYADYALSIIYFYDHSSKATDYVETAQTALIQSLNLDPKFAEAEALLGQCYGVEIALHPWKGIFLGGKAKDAIHRAYQLDPSNPRVVLLKGSSNYNTPVLFGGDKTLGVKEFRESLWLFGTYKASDSKAPTWGKAMAYYSLGYAEAQAGNLTQARADYEAALKLNPDYKAALRRLSRLEKTNSEKWN